jgi:hypothetical protein
MLAPGDWTFQVLITQTGWSKTAWLGPSHDEGVKERRAAALLSGTALVPFWSPRAKQLTLRVDARGTDLTQVARTEWRLHTADGAAGRELALRLGLASVGGPLPDQATVVLHRVGRADVLSIPAPARTGENANGPVFEVRAALPSIPAGRWRVSLGLGVPGWPEPTPIGAQLVVFARGRAWIVKERSARQLVGGLRRRAARSRLGGVMLRARKLVNQRGKR